MNKFIGRQIDNYRIDALLGEGGMGVVYRGFDLNLAQPVAIKMMRPDLARQPEFQQRFLQEARAAALLGEHPCIIRVLYFGMSRDLLYMVMAYVSGGSLSDHILRMQKTGEVAQLREILALLAQVADALAFAHRHKVIHRDVKPSNVLLQRLENPEGEGYPPLRAIVTDFGLAKLLKDGLETNTGGGIGTFAYMSPEQCLRKELDGRSDIYSLGVMLYQLTTGRLPFDIQSPAEAGLKHLNEIPPAPREVSPGLPGSVETIIQKAISKKPEDRFRTAEAMAAALREALKNLSEAEITKFHQNRNTLSLTTHLQSTPIPEPSRMGFDLGPGLAGDHLVIAQNDHTPRTIRLDKAQFTIGREEDNDIVLSDNDVSRHHALIKRSTTGWQVVDLKSTNHTFLEGIELLSGVPEAIAPGKTFRIGPFFIHWRTAEASAGVTRNQSLPAAKPPFPAGAKQYQTGSGLLSVVVNPENLTVTPGKSAEAKLDLFNQSLIVDHFVLQVEGIPAGWVDLPKEQVRLDSGSSGTFAFSVHPPLDSSARAGLYPFTLKVKSISRPEEIATARGNLTVQPFEKFWVDMQPSRLASGGKTRLLIRNEGNDDGVYRLVGRDPAETVNFGGEQGRIKVPAGETQAIKMTLTAKNRPWMGAVQQLPFEVQVKSVTGVSEIKDGQLDVKPWFSSWTWPLAGSLLFVLCISASCLLFLISSGENPVAWLSNLLDGGGRRSTAIAPGPPQLDGGESNSPGTSPSETPLTTSPSLTSPPPVSPQGKALVWKNVENRAVITRDEEYWEKYQAGTGQSGLYLRTDTIEAFGDFLELNDDHTYVIEQDGVRTDGSWKIDADKLILIP